MNWFERLAARRAARQFARRLPPQLVAGWGRSKSYSPGQMAAALRKARLGGRYVAVAYAAFVTEEDYAAIATGLPLALSYEEARACYRPQHAPWRAYVQDPISNSEAAIRHGLML